MGAQAPRGECSPAPKQERKSIDEGFCTIEVLFDERGEPADYRFHETNLAFERQTGVENAAGRTARELVPDHEEFWYEIFGRIALTGEATRFEHEAAALGRHYDVYAFRIGEPEENRLGVIFNDILARKRAEEERERLGVLEASARAEGAERERISRELHDRVAHTMGVALQALELHYALAKRAPERAAETLEVAREATRDALDQTRDLSTQLARRGMEVTSDGLGAALSELLASYVPDGVETALSVEGDESAVPPTVGEEAYLVMREAVRNAVEHSGCGESPLARGRWHRVHEGARGAAGRGVGTRLEARERHRGGGPDPPGKVRAVHPPSGRSIARTLPRRRSEESGSKALRIGVLAPSFNGYASSVPLLQSGRTRSAAWA